jgi:hypothetical protein
LDSSAAWTKFHASYVSSVLPWRGRVPWVATVAYVAALSVWTDGGRRPVAWLASLVALAVALLAAGQDNTVARGVVWGFAVVLASNGANAESRLLDGIRVLGVLVAAAGACLALTRIPSEPGLAVARRSSPRAAVGAIVATSALALAAGVAQGQASPGWVATHARAWALVALAASAAALFGSVQWALRTRQLELGVAERATAMREGVSALFGAAVAIALVGHARPAAAGALAVAASGLLVTKAAQHPDALLVRRVARRAVVLVIAGGGVALLGASVASSGFSGDAWLATVLTAVVAVAIGTAASRLEAPMRPAGGAWLDAFARARDEAACAEPQDAIREALQALRAPGGPGSSSPELWTFSPTVVTTVDAAGYLHERPGELPPSLVLLAATEPEATLRLDVLRAIEVRRPESRPLLKWMAERRAMLATVVGWGGETEGVLVMPHAGRTEGVTLEEVRAFKLLADRLATACRARGALSRMLTRAHDATLRATRAEERAEGLLRERALDLTRNALAAARLARPATVGIYSAASRTALDRLEQRAAAGAPIALVAPSGADPVPYLARAHLAGARARGPLVLVDSTSAREHDLARWSDRETSPLALADGGMLVLLDGAALPAPVQELVARACAERRGPWDGELDVQLALTGLAPPDDLVAQDRLSPLLAARLGDARGAPVALPRLRDRTEDVRAILTDGLARQGLRVIGRPVGIEQAAYAKLVEHEFPGEDAELAALVQLLVSRCAADPQRDVVRAGDLEGCL